MKKRSDFGVDFWMLANRAMMWHNINSCSCVNGLDKIVHCYTNLHRLVPHAKAVHTLYAADDITSCFKGRARLVAEKFRPVRKPLN